MMISVLKKPKGAAVLLFFLVLCEDRLVAGQHVRQHQQSRRRDEKAKARVSESQSNECSCAKTICFDCQAHGFLCLVSIRLLITPKYLSHHGYRYVHIM